MLGFVNIVTITEVILITSHVAGPSEGHARNENESTLISSHFL